MYDIHVQHVLTRHGFTIEAFILHVSDIGIKINKNTYQTLYFLHIIQNSFCFHAIYHLFLVYI